MENGYTQRSQGTKAPSSQPIRDFEPIGQILLESDKAAHELLAMARQIADLLGGCAAEQAGKAVPTLDDLRGCLIEHRITISAIHVELQRALRNLKG